MTNENAISQKFSHIPEWRRDVINPPKLGEEPYVHNTALIIDSIIGSWTEVGPYAEIIESELGDYTYIAGVHTSITYADVGKFCSIASSVRINPVQHPMERATQHHCTYRRRQYDFDTMDDNELFEWRRSQRIKIGHDVWIGHGAIVMPGVDVSTGAVVGAGAVITKDVEPYTIVVGVPAEPLRTRFSKKIIDSLLASRWWDWEHENIKARFNELFDAKSFARKYGKSKSKS